MIDIEIVTDDEALLKDLLNGRAPERGVPVVVAGNAEIKLVRGRGLGFSVGDAVVFVLENINAIAVSIFASYLYDKLKGRVQRLSICGSDIEVDEVKIQEALENATENVKTLGHG